MTSELPMQEAGALVSVAIFVVVTLGWWMAFRMNGTAPPSLRYGMAALWLMSMLRLYSATSFVWAEDAGLAGLLPPLRIGVLVVLTLTLILVLALVGFYWRRWRSTR